MNQKTIFFIPLFLLIFFPTITVHAQESDLSYSQTVVVQTDTETAITDFPVTCFEVPNSIEPVTEDQITKSEFITDENGEIRIQSDTQKNAHYYCEAAQPATPDGCWYFPNQSSRFQLTENKTSTAYLIALSSVETCDTNMDINESNSASITAYLPSGTPAPIQNKNINQQEAMQTEEPDIQSDSAPEPTSVWEWITTTIKKFFNF